MISIIIPTYNRADLIIDTLMSIKEQSYTNWECLIIDDHSTDNTSEVVNDSIKDDSRFQYLRRPDDKKKGPSACRNYGFLKSEGDYIQFFDSDDIMHKEHLEKKINVITVNQRHMVFCRIQHFHGNMQRIDLEPNNYVFNNDNLFEDLILGKFTLGMIVPMWKKTFLEKQALLDEDIKLNEDLELHARLLCKKPESSFINEALIYVRSDVDSITSAFFETPGPYINDYLEVKRRVLKLAINNDKINKGQMKIILAQFRACLSIKDYKSCGKILSFINTYMSDKSISAKFKLLRIKIAYNVFKLLGRGDTKFKALLKF